MWLVSALRVKCEGTELLAYVLIFDTSLSPLKNLPLQFLWSLLPTRS